MDSGTATILGSTGRRPKEDCRCERGVMGFVEPESERPAADLLVAAATEGCRSFWMALHTGLRSPPTLIPSPATRRGRARPLLCGEHGERRGMSCATRAEAGDVPHEPLPGNWWPVTR